MMKHTENFSGLPNAAPKQKWCHAIGPRRYPGLFGEIEPPQPVSGVPSSKLARTSDRSYATIITLSQ